VFVTIPKLFEDHFAAAFLISRNFLKGRFTLRVQTLGVLVNVFCTVQRLRSKVFHEGRITTANSLFAVHSVALDRTFAQLDFGPKFACPTRGYYLGMGVVGRDK